MVMMPQFLRGTIYILLGSSDGKDCDHASLHNAKIVINDLDQEDQGVCGAGGIVDNLERAVILPMTISQPNFITNMGALAEEAEVMTFRFNVSPSLLQASEDTSGLYNIISTRITSFDVGRILLLEDGGYLSIEDMLPVLSLDSTTEIAMGGSILEHVEYVVEVMKGPRMANNIHFARVKSALVTRCPIGQIHLLRHSSFCLRVMA